MIEAWGLFDNPRRAAGYVRRDLKGDTLYSSFHHRDIELYFGALGSGVTRVKDALTTRMLEAGVITAQQKAACDARIQSAFSSREKIEAFDGFSVEEIYRCINRLRRETLGAQTMARWQAINAENDETLRDPVIDQREQKKALLERAACVIAALYDESWLCRMHSDLMEARRRNKEIFVLCGEDFVSEELQRSRLADVGAVFVTDAGCAALQAHLQSGDAAIMAYGEEALIQCRSLQAEAVVHARPEGYFARALINTLDEMKSCIVYVPAHFDITKYVPLRERARLTYWQLWQLYKDVGGEVYGCTVEEMYRRWPQYFINIYQNDTQCREAQAECPLRVCMPREGDAFAQHDFAREKAVAEYLNGFSNLTFSAHYFDGELASCPLPYEAPPEEKGILVHTVRVKAARNAGVLSRAENVPLRRMFTGGQTGLFSNFLFFMTPKLANLYNSLRHDRPIEQADVTAGHLDYMLCRDKNKRTETFPLFDKMCMAMKEDGTFLFFNFRLGGGKVRVGQKEFCWSKSDVNTTQDVPVCVYTPYLSCGDEGADRNTYRRQVGEGRVNLVVLQDRIHCIRQGDVVLPSAGVVVSLRADAAQALICGLPPLQDGYYDAEKLDFAVELDAPEGIDPQEWQTVRWAYGGGLSLIRSGKALSDSANLHAWFGAEGWTSPLSRQTQESDLHTLSKHPRTAVGQTDNGDMVILVFSGRSRLSAGADYVEMCRIARKIYPDIRHLMNADGGASAVLCMVRDGVVTELNLPSTSSVSSAGMARPIKTLLYVPAE